jgi:hypothetical protein
MTELILLVFMLFFHIIADYNLQGILASMKQKKWWETNYPDKFYQNDYIIALIEHAFSWTVMVHIPVWSYSVYFNRQFNGGHYYVFIFIFISMWYLHAFADNAKANQNNSNLIIDQMIHIIQIIIIWSAYILFGTFGA